MKEKKLLKQSLLIGALTSSFGVFISKALGLIYYSPLSALAGEENMVFYSVTYTYYDLLLKISSAGIPFAIAALVAKYVAKEDYKTANVVRKLGTSIVMALSFLCVFFFIILATPLAKQSMGAFASESDIKNLKILFYILLFAVILVPYLSVVRSYYQGLKRFDLYASSQVLEQFVRVFFIVASGYVFVKVLKLDSIWAIYMAIAAAGIAALVSIIFFKLTTRKDDARIAELINNQESPSETRSTVFKEILTLGIPYLIISFLGTAGPLINTTFFLSYATSKAGMPINDAKLSLGILQANCSKLNAIPQVLTSGFCAGLVPYLTESLEQNNYEKISKQVLQIVNTVLYILIPVLFIFFFFAKDIYYIMYGGKNLELGTSLFRASTAIGFTETVLPIFSSIMITLRLKKESILTLLLTSFIKLSTFFACIRLFWAYGMVVSTCLASIAGMIIYMLILKKTFDIRFKQTFNQFGLIILSSFAMVIVPLIIAYLVGFEYTSRLQAIVYMGSYGLLMLTGYYLITAKLKLITKIFGIREPSVLKLFKKFKM